MTQWKQRSRVTTNADAGRRNRLSHTVIRWAPSVTNRGSVAQIGRHTGNLYASNTLGAILGSLCGGLVMIPILGTKASLAVLAFLFLANGTMSSAQAV